MIKIGGLNFNEVWLVDFEFSQSPGEKYPDVHCVVAKELNSKRTLRIWSDELHTLTTPPYSVGNGSLFIAYYAAAELACHRALGWKLPQNILDLCVEFKNMTSGLDLTVATNNKRSLLGALAYFGIDMKSAVEKYEMRELAIRGGPFTATERADLLEYCESDVVALEKLLPKMDAYIDLPRALLRGRYKKALARIEGVGIPIDLEALEILERLWPEVEQRLIEKVDSGSEYNCYDKGIWKSERFARWLNERNISWPLHESGQLVLKNEIFKDMSRVYPEIKKLYTLRMTLAQMTQNKLEIGKDGRNRSSLWAFSSKTGRNQPSTSKFIFGRSKWFRGLIRPCPGFGLAYVDWSQQEFGIAAALSGDCAMKSAYLASDPYLEFAKQAKAITQLTPVEKIEEIRSRFKRCAFGLQYGMGKRGLAMNIGQSPAHAKELIRQHTELYSTFWLWIDSAINHAMLKGSLHSVFGWKINVDDKTKASSLLNFPMQANGAEMLRLACCLATESGISICAPVHDALLIEAPLDQLDAVVKTVQKIMEDASRIVLQGFTLRSKVQLVRYPERFIEKDGQEMWNIIWRLIHEFGERVPVSIWAPCLFIFVRLPDLLQNTCTLLFLYMIRDIKI